MAYLSLPIGWFELGKRTVRETIADDCLNLAAQLAYYFVLALFPALLFLVALASFFPVANLVDTIVRTLARVAPPDVLTIVSDQIAALSEARDGGLLTTGMVLTVWSSSSGIAAVMNALNHAYDIDEARPWWRVRLTAIGITIGVGLFTVASFALVVVGPEFAERLARWFGLGQAFVWAWMVLQWPVVFALVATALALVYFFGPDAEQEWVWITPGSLVGTFLWILFSLGFRYYVTHLADYNGTYGAIGGVIVLLLWFYATGLAILIGAEVNAEVEHASPHGKAPGQKVPGRRRKIGTLAARAWEEARRRLPSGRPFPAARP